MLTIIYFQRNNINYSHIIVTRVNVHPVCSIVGVASRDQS